MRVILFREHITYILRIEGHILGIECKCVVPSKSDKPLIIRRFGEDHPGVGL